MQKDPGLELIGVLKNLFQQYEEGAITAREMAGAILVRTDAAFDSLPFAEGELEESIQYNASRLD